MTKEKKVFDIDLDSLAPKPKKVKLGDKIITVDPPKTLQLIKIIRLGQKIKDANTDEEMAQSMDDLVIPVKEIITDLKDITLSMGQVNALTDMIVDMAMPGQLEELKKRGISLDTAKKAQAGS